MSGQAIEERLAKVEKSLRVWKVSFVAMAVVLIGVAADNPFKLKGIGDFESITTMSISIVNEKGEQRGFFGIPPVGDNKSPIIGVHSPETGATLIRSGTPIIKGVDANGKAFESK